MTGNSDGEFRDENDFRKFLQHAMDNAEGWAASSWSNPFKHDRIVEAMAQIVRTCVQLFNRGFQSFCQKSIQVNDTLKEFAKKEDEFKWGWWRKGEPLKHDDGTWVGNDAPSLVETVYLEGSGIIKHDYLTIPDPIQLDTVVFEQNGVEALMGVATAGQLDSICSVPWMDPKMTSSEFGASVLDNSIDANRWQRLVDHVRIEEIREFAEGQETNLFNPVLLYANQDDVSLNDTGNNHRQVIVPFNFLHNRFGVFTDYFPLPEDYDNRPIWIIDGQHRIRGFGSSKRGSRTPIPFVLVIGDGSAEHVSKVAKIFTEINTTSKELHVLHKIYLNYRFGMVSKLGDYRFKTENGEPVFDPEGIPIPLESSRHHRRAYELALYMASVENSPIFSSIQFQAPAGVNSNPVWVSDAYKWMGTTTSWFSTGIYSKDKSDTYCKKECLNFFLAFKELCDSWPGGDSKWHVGASSNKQLLQRKGPFPVLLDTMNYLVKKIIEDTTVERPISVDKFKRFLEPIKWVDWTDQRLTKSRLAGQNNTNQKHLNLWIQTAIENGHSYSKSEILDASEESVAGKGIIALPKRNQISLKSTESFPVLRSMQVKIEMPIHCTKYTWQVQSGHDDDFKAVEIIKDDITEEDSHSILTITPEHITAECTHIKIVVAFDNGMGTAYSGEKVYSRNSNDE